MGQIIQETLASGTLIYRYGYEGGTFTAPAGTPFEGRALPPGSESNPYVVYEVVKPLPVKAGLAIPWFGQLRLSIQYELPQSVGDLIQSGILSLGGGVTRYLYVHDNRGNIVGRVDISGKLVDSYAYDPWGKVLSSMEAAITLEQQVPQDLRQPIRDIVHELVIGNFASLEADGRRRLFCR